MLELVSVTTGYGKRRAINDVSIGVTSGKLVSIIGHNGAGKTTLLKAVMGMLPLWSGKIIVEKTDITHTTIADRVRAGIAYAPQGNRVFTEMSVRDNLIVSGRTCEGWKDSDSIIEMGCARFPILSQLLNKRAGLLSGGERQATTMAMAMVRSPKILLLDEPSLGLSPMAILDMFGTLERLRTAEGITIVIAEQRVVQVLSIADEYYAMKAGEIVSSGVCKEMDMDRVFHTTFL